ncbi:M6 family metalloprotease domain-containing protein [Micromonospora sp. DT231]|uniref:M6 family metalloprotease domain-containing protein n=1 Tax=Micromonospora sp. DT231 TaxID=3416526 RepID=UPI003CF99E76
MPLRSKAAAVISGAVAVALGITAVPAASAPPTAGPAGSNQAAAVPASPTDCLLPAADVYNEHEGPADYGRWLQPTGTLRGIVLFVGFPGVTPPAGELAQRKRLLSGAPAWFSQSSYGGVTLQLTFDTVWRQLPNSQTTYSGYNVDFNVQRAYVQDAVNVADPAINFSQYDLVYVVAPSNASSLPNSPSFIASVGWGAWADGVELRHGATFGQDLSHWGYKVLNHETGHVFGLPDLYAYAADQHQAAGGWDLMGLISGPAPDLFAWHKWKLGWLADTQIVCQDGSGSTPATLTPLGASGGTKALVVRTGERDAVVVENRQVSQLDVSSSCFQPGVLVYRVTTTVGGGGIPPGSNTPVPDGPRPIRVADRLPNSTIAGCDARAAELANATLTAVNHAVTVAGVTVRVTGHSGSNRSVQVTVP